MKVWQLEMKLICERGKVMHCTFGTNLLKSLFPPGGCTPLCHRLQTMGAHQDSLILDLAMQMSSFCQQKVQETLEPAQMLCTSISHC